MTIFQKLICWSLRDQHPKNGHSLVNQFMIRSWTRDHRRSRTRDHVVHDPLGDFRPLEVNFKKKWETSFPRSYHKWSPDKSISRSPQLKKKRRRPPKKEKRGSRWEPREKEKGFKDTETLSTGSTSDTGVGCYCLRCIPTTVIATSRIQQVVNSHWHVYAGGRKKKPNWKENKKSLF